MTTRKELIERIQSMKLGTQEMLDSAKKDAMLIPFDTLFVSKEYGCVVWRTGDDLDEDGSVGMTGPGQYFSAKELLPITEE